MTYRQKDQIVAICACAFIIIYMVAVYILNRRKDTPSGSASISPPREGTKVSSSMRNEKARFFSNDIIITSSNRPPTGLSIGGERVSEREFDIGMRQLILTDFMKLFSGGDPKNYFITNVNAEFRFNVGFPVNKPVTKSVVYEIYSVYTVHIRYFRVHLDNGSGVVRYDEKRIEDIAWRWSTKAVTRNFRYKGFEATNSAIQRYIDSNTAV